MDYLVRSPRQATTVYGLDGNSAPRKKSAFYVRFCRSSFGQAASGWQDNLGFMVKSLDRPSVQPKLEEINQYNKKRQITTGFDIAPMRMVLYDTADSMVMRMWNEYSKWYFGDFSQGDETSFQYDVTSPEMVGEDVGFGYVPRPGTGDGKDSIDLNSQFFFSKIEVYQVFGGEFTQFDLINPKIKQFDPDELDYSDYEAATISMTIAYEAILYRNNGAPSPIDSKSEINAVFEGEFNGDTFDVAGAPTRHNLQTFEGDFVQMATDDFRLNRPIRVSDLGTDSGNTLGSGALSQFGNFDFGSLAPTVRLGAGTARDISYLASGNNALTTLINMPTGPERVSNPESRAFSGGSTTRSTVSAALLDATEGALRGAGAKNDYGAAYISRNLVGAVAASTILDGNSSRDQMTNTYPDGLALNSQSYGVINTQRPSYSQIGFNAPTGVSSAPGRYVTNGTPTQPIPLSTLALQDRA